MLSIDECRKLIEGGEKCTHKEIEEIRDTLYGLVNIAFDARLEGKVKANRT